MPSLCPRFESFFRQARWELSILPPSREPPVFVLDFHELDKVGDPMNPATQLSTRGARSPPKWTPGEEIERIAVSIENDGGPAPMMRIAHDIENSSSKVLRYIARPSDDGPQNGENVTLNHASTAALVAPLFAQPEIPTTVQGSVARTLDFVEGQFVSITEAMPETKYTFVPTAGKFDDVRSFGEQVKHVACANFAFFNEIEGKTPPASCETGGPSKATSKAELIRYLRDSFDYGNRVLATVNEKSALERVDGRYAGPNTKLGMMVTAVWHITDHYGQLVEYLRMNGIVPPATQKYGLRVR